MDAPRERPGPAGVDLIGLRQDVWVRTAVRNHGLVAQRVRGEVLFAVAGEGGPAYPARLGGKLGAPNAQPHTHGSILCIDANGAVRWREDFRHGKKSCHVSPFPAFLDITGTGHWAVSCVSDMHETGHPGEMQLYAPEGRLLWSTPVPGEYPWGNGACVVADLDGDGRREIVYGNCGETTCVDAQTGRIRWSFRDGVKTCHGRLALGDVNGDGLPELCFGSEYADDEARRLSSFFILDGKGNVLHRRRGVLGDLGSTPIVLADINTDGKLEFIVASQNLTWFEPLHPTSIYCVDGRLEDVHSPIPTGTPRFTVGDFDRDGHVEAIGIQDYRDGGPLGEEAIVCVDLTLGTIKWKREVPRIWLTGDPMAADLDGDGAMEIVLTTNYPSGYAHQPGTQPWGDVYIMKPNGDLLFRRTFPDAVFSPIAIDADGDGLNELYLPCHDGTIYAMTTPGRATSDSWPLPQANERRTGWSATVCHQDVWSKDFSTATGTLIGAKHEAG